MPNRTHSRAAIVSTPMICRPPVCQARTNKRSFSCHKFSCLSFPCHYFPATLPTSIESADDLDERGSSPERCGNWWPFASQPYRADEGIAIKRLSVCDFSRAANRISVHHPARCPVPERPVCPRAPLSCPGSFPTRTTRNSRERDDKKMGDKKIPSDEQVSAERQNQ